MRSFVAASCCLIVGLEILIGVPVAVCLGFLCFGSDFTSVYVAESQYHSPVYASVPGTPASLPAGLPVPAFDPYASPPAHPALCPAPVSSTACVPPVVSPIIASLPASDMAAAPPPPVPSQATDVGLRQVLAHVCVGEACLAAEKDGAPAHELKDSLLATAHLLYRQADRHEADQEYSLADQLRTLARDLRDEAENISRRQPTPEPVDQDSSTATVGPPPLG